MAIADVAVAEVTEERAAALPAEIPWHLGAGPGTIRIQLRSTLHRVAMGAGLARRAELVAAVRAIPGLPGLTTSPAGGTFAIGGPGWMGLSAIGIPPPRQPMPLDWMVAGMRRWFEAVLRPLGCAPAVGRVDRAWCAGFSDLGVGGRKLAGLGFRVTRDWVLARGMLAVRPLDPRDAELLDACHRLIGVRIDPGAATSLAECTGDRSWTVPAAMERFASTPAPS